jgi:hypothetical protein
MKDYVGERAVGGAQLVEALRCKAEGHVVTGIFH